MSSHVDRTTLPVLESYNHFQKWTAWAPQADGSRIRAKIEPDHDTHIGDSDSYGTLSEGRRSFSSMNARPAGFNGAARKLVDRGGSIWWQPPEHLDAEGIQAVAKRVQAYLHESWSFVGIVVQRESAPCPHCGERKRTDASLWGIESDETSYLQDVAADLAEVLRRLPPTGFLPRL